MRSVAGTHYIRDEQGNLVPFEQIYDRYFEPIFHYILHRLANVADAEDLTAQTFFKALRGLWKFRWSGVPFSAWLYRIATNEIHSFMRQKGRQRRAGLAEAPAPETETALAEDSELADAEKKLRQNRLFMELAACIQMLKPEEQALVVLHYLEQKPYAEIAQILGKRQGTLVMRTHRALKKLKEKLEQRGIDHEEIRASFKTTAYTGYQGADIQAEFAP